MKFQTPSSKFQVPNKPHAPGSKELVVVNPGAFSEAQQLWPTTADGSFLGIWCLEFLWNLELEIWNFPPVP